MKNSFIIKMYSYLMDEVEGHKNYESVAKRMKMDGMSEFSSMFSTMAENEKHHAENIIKIINEYMSKEDKPDSEFNEFIKELNSIVSDALN